MKRLTLLLLFPLVALAAPQALHNDSKTGVVTETPVKFTLNQVYLNGILLESQLGGGGLSNGDKGDVTLSGSPAGSVWTVDALPESRITNLTTDLAAKQPLDSDLTALAALTTDSFGLQLLTKSSAANVRTYIGAGTSSFSGLFTGLNFTGSNLSSIATRTFDSLQFTTGAGKFAYSSGGFSLTGVDSASVFNVDLSNGSNDDNQINFYGINSTGDPVFKIDGHGTLTLSDDNFGNHSVYVDLASVNGQRTIHWPNKSGTLALTSDTSRVFNVKDYGALGNGSTDDTVAIQAAVTAVAAAGGGTIYFPNGVYIVGGALQNTSGANAQLLLPSVVAPGTQQYTVRFLGETPVSQIPWFLTSPAGNTPSSAVVIKSTLASGTGALIGGYSATGFQNFTNITFIAQNINFRMPVNPTNSGINCFYVNSVILEDCVVDSGNWIGNTITQPTTATSYGIKLPQNNNGGNIFLNRVQVIGFNTGILNAEHAIATQVEIYHCNVAMENAFAYHTSRYSRLLYHNCVRGLKWTGVHYINVSTLDVEHTDQAAWYATTYDIDDGSNLGVGKINFHIVKSGTGVTQALLANGGGNLSLNTSDSRINIYQLAEGSGVNVISFGGVPNPASSTAHGLVSGIYGNTNYLSLNSKGAYPLYLNPDNSNAAATVDIFNGKFSFSQPGVFTLTQGAIVGGTTGLSLTAGGTNQSVVVNPSGSGKLSLTGSNAAGSNLWIDNTSTTGFASLATLNNSSTNYNQFLTFGTSYVGNRFGTLAAAGLNEFSAHGVLVIGTDNANPLYFGTNGAVAASFDSSGLFTLNAGAVISSSSLTLSGNQSAAAWTTNGIRIKGISGTLTDTSSSGTVAAAYTNKLGGNTIAASSATTFTDYISSYFSEPVAGTNVTLTNKWGLGADSLYIGTSNPVKITSAGILSAANPALTTPKVTTAIQDTNGNSMLAFTATGSSIFGFTLTNAASGGTVALGVTVPTQAASGIAGTPLSIRASDAVAGSSNAGAVAGGALTLTAGDAKRLTSGNADGGSVLLVAGNKIGSGNDGVISFNASGGVKAQVKGSFEFSAPLLIERDTALQWSNANSFGGSAVLGLGWNANGVLQINNGTTGQWGSILTGVRDSGTTTVTNGLTVGHQSTGTPAAGLGSGILFNINDSTTADVNAGQFYVKWTDATHATRTSQAGIALVNSAGALIDALIIKPTGVGILGTTTNDNATAGNVGEYVSASVVVGSATALTTATPKTVTSISITAGDWDVTAIGALTGASTGTEFDVAIGTTTNSLTGTVLGDTRCQTPTVSLTGADASLMVPAARVSISSTTTYYLIVQETFTVGTPSAYGRISARRVR